MHLIRFWIALMALMAFPATIFARYTLVLPSSGSSNQMIGYTDTGQQFGAVTLAGPAQAAFTNLAGTTAWVVYEGSNTPVGFVPIVNNAFSGQLTGIRLDGYTAKAWRLSPGGTRLAVLGADPFNQNSCAVFVLDTGSGQFVPWRGTLFQQGIPLDIAYSNDGETIAVLTNTSLIFIRNEDGAVASQYLFPTGAAPSNPSFLSVGPNGSFYVSSLYRLHEFASRSPYGLLGTTETVAYPGPLSFSPDGRYALTQDRRGFQNAFSLFGFDLNARDTASGFGAGTPLQGATIPSNIPAVPLSVESVTVINESQAVAFSSANGRMYLISYPVLTVSEFNAGAATTIQGIAGVAFSSEVPGVRLLWYNIGGALYRYDFTTATVSSPINSILGRPFFTTLPNPDVTNLQTLRTYNANQPATAAQPLPRPVFVRALDGFGRPINGAPVSVQAETPGVGITNVPNATNAQGYAWATLTAPGSGGEFAVIFNIAGRTARVVNGTAASGGGGGGGTGGGGTGGTPVAGLVRVAGNGSIRMNLDATSPIELKVRALGSDGKPAPGVTINWSEIGGVQFILTTADGSSSVTDAEGYASIQCLLAGGSNDPFSSYTSYQVSATSTVGSTSFTLIGYPFAAGSASGAPIGQIIKPDPESGIQSFTLKLGEPLIDALRVVVVGTVGVGFGQPVVGAGVRAVPNNIDPVAGPVVTCEGDVVLTASDGVASCNLVARGKTGTGFFNIDIGWGHQTFAGYRFTVEPGPPIAPVISSGNNQTIRPGEDAPGTLAVVLQDAGGNILRDVPVTWEVVTANSLTLFNTISVSDFNGRVSTRVRGGTTAGTFQVRVRINNTTLSTVFNVTIENVVGGFSKVSGDNQPTVVINTQFPSPLVVLVFDQANRPLSNVQVNFAVASGSATVSPAVATTNAQGQASVTVTAGSQAGTITIRATLQNFTPITWTLNSRLPGPVLTAQSFTNFATGEVGVVPGSLVLITGAGIAPNLRGERNANLMAAQLPYEIEGVTVEFRSSGRQAFAPLLRVANVNNVETALIQVPYELAGATTTDVRVVSGGDILVTGVPVRPVGPGILEDTLGGARAAIAIRSDGLRVTPNTPARRGEIIRLYVIGLGQTTPTAETNRVGMIDQKVNAAVAVGIDDRGVTPMSVHMAENLFAIYEVVFRVPADAVIGNARPLGLVIEPTPGQQFYANGSILAISAQ